MTEFRKVDAIVAGDITIHGLAPKPLERLRRTLSFRNPDYLKALRRRVPTGSIPDRIDCLVEEPDGSVRVPRGATRDIRASLAEDFLEPRWIDRRCDGWSLPIDAVSTALAAARSKRPLRPYQGSGITRARERMQGLIVIACGGGKTTLGVDAIGEIGRTAIVLVHTEDLLDQWVETVRARLGLEAGTIKNGETNLRRVTIAMVQTLIRILESPEGRDLGARFGTALVDEAHHTPCETFQRALPHLPARFRIGLTATPDREDGSERLMDWSFGDRLIEVAAPELIAAGWLTKPDVEFVETDFEFSYDGPEKRRMAALQRAIVADPKRNAIIADIAARDAAAGETVLILSNHKAHCRALGRLIWERGVEARVLVGKSGKANKRARKETIQGMRDGAVPLVVATSLADEGLDVERLSRVILALPQRARGPTMQRVGRLMRNFEGKKPILYDVIDPRVSTLASRADERRRVYRKLDLLR